MTHDEAIRKLNAMVVGPDDDEPRLKEEFHVEADAILLRYLEHHDAKEIADAYRAVDERVGFWYS